VQPCGRISMSLGARTPMIAHVLRQWGQVGTS
jgi:hypothetical protein